MLFGINKLSIFALFDERKDRTNPVWHNQNELNENG